MIDVIELGEQVEESINEGISTSQWVETDVCREEPARPAIDLDEQSITWKSRHIYKSYNLMKPVKWPFKLYYLNFS